MAEKQSDESRYESRHGGGWITPAQYIAEIMCERIAKKNKKDLPVRFWNLPTWKRNFMSQILAANNVLKIYPPKVVLAALRRERNVYSLRAGWFDAVMQEEQIKLQTSLEKAEKEEPKPEPQTINTTEKPRQSFSTGKSTLSKLRDLDG